MRAVLQALVSWLFCLVFGVVASLLVILTFGRVSHALTPALLRFWGRVMLRIAGVTLSVDGLEHLEKQTHKVAVFNHGSMLDAFLVTAIMPPGSIAAIKREVLYYPVVNFTLYFCGFLFIDRGSGDRAKRTMQRAAKRMQDEKLTVFISPEGTRAKTPELLPFKKGAFHLALQSNAPIVPVLIDGAFDLHPPGQWWSTPGHVQIRVLPPRPIDFTAETIGPAADALHRTFVHELATLRAERELGAGALAAA